MTDTLAPAGLPGRPGGWRHAPRDPGPGGWPVRLSFPDAARYPKAEVFAVCEVLAEAEVVLRNIGAAALAERLSSVFDSMERGLCDG